MQTERDELVICESTGTGFMQSETPSPPSSPESGEFAVWWDEVTDLIGKTEDIHWQLGDKLIEGKRKFPHLWEDVRRKLNAHTSALNKMVGCARAFPPDTRQHDIPFSFYDELVPIKDANARFAKLTEVAPRIKSGDLSVVGLRKELRQGTKKDTDPDPSAGIKVWIRSVHEVRDFLKERPVGWWDDERKEFARKELSWIVEFYDENLVE